VEHWTTAFLGAWQMENLLPFYEPIEPDYISYETLINSDDAFLCLESLAIDYGYDDDL